MKSYHDKSIFLVLANGEAIETVTPFIRNFNVKENFNDMWEISFDLLEKIQVKDEEYVLEFYETIENKRRFLIKDIGEYVVSDMDEPNDGVYRYKKLTCKSIEYEFNNIYTSFKNSAYLYLQTETAMDKGIMNHILSYYPEWTVGYIDPLLENKTRYFDFRKQRLYQLMINDIESSFDCIFDYDRLTKKVDMKHLSNAITDGDIYLSYDLLIKNANITPISDEVITVLDVTGGNLDIRRVNPTGTNYFYNFSYYMDTKWMSQGLINAINIWQNKIVQYQTEYSDLFEQYVVVATQIEIISPLYEQAWQLQQKLNDEFFMIEANLGNPYTQQELDNARFALIEQSGIASNYRSQLFNTLYPQINSIDNQLTAINNICKLESNFTLVQQIELKDFMYYGDYENKAFSFVDGMTENNKKEISKLLYAQGKVHSDRVCRPKRAYDIDIINFTKMIGAEEYTEELKTGLYIYVRLNEYSIKKLILTSINIPDVYNNPKDIKLTFSDKLRYTDDLNVLHELLNEVTRRLKETEEQKLQIENINKNIVGINGSLVKQTDRIDTLVKSLEGTNRSVTEIKTEIINIMPKFLQYATIPTSAQLIADGVVVGDVILVRG